MDEKQTGVTEKTTMGKPTVEDKKPDTTTEKKEK